MIENFSKEELNNEQWKVIDGYNGLYEVSSLGRVRSKKYGYWRILKPRNSGCGYFSVTLSKNGQLRYFLVHRLVAQAFIPNSDDSKTQINHIDECKQNNRVSNLEYCTAQYNLTYNDLHHRRKKRPQSKRDEIRPLYDQNLTCQQNLELFRAKGIECSERTVRKLRKDLNLKRQYNIRHKLKDLYDPNLTYSENLKHFKAKGIECSYGTLYYIRKDLGLSKPRKTKQIS